jgi:hypothetical protein
MAHSNMPQAQTDQRQQGDDGVREVRQSKVSRPSCAVL